MPETNLKDGRVSQYGLACGYIDRDARLCESGREFIIDLSCNGATYDVDAYFDGETRQRYQGVVEGWAQFDTLTEARKFKSRIMRMRNTASVIVACMSAMSHLYRDPLDDMQPVNPTYEGQTLRQSMREAERKFCS